MIADQFFMMILPWCWI